MSDKPALPLRERIAISNQAWSDALLEMEMFADVLIVSSEDGARFDVLAPGGLEDHEILEKLRHATKAQEQKMERS